MAKKTYKHTRTKIVEDLEHSGNHFNTSLNSLSEILGELAEAGDVTRITYDIDDGVSRRVVSEQLDTQSNKLYELLSEAQDIIDDLRDHSGNLDEVVDYLLEEGVKKKKVKKKTSD
jgi:ABC-type transporter Mla subunit MlaD